MKSFFSKIRRIFITQESSLLINIKRHIELSQQALDILIRSQDASDEQKMELYREIENIEKEGDTLANEMVNQILGGAITVNLQNYLITLIDILDNILDVIHFLGGETYRRKYFRQLISSEILDIEYKIKNYLKHSVESIEKLHDLVDMVISGMYTDIVKKVSEIERLEEEGDDIKHQLIDSIYSKWQKIKEPYYSYLIHYIYMIDQMQDLTEDASNIILLVAQHIVM